MGRGDDYIITGAEIAGENANKRMGWGRIRAFSIECAHKYASLQDR